jgi:drug/metabolite transporter (DMT)-like permease
VLVLAGVSWAVSERTAASPHTTTHARGRFGLGVVLALGGALGQAGGFILSKHGMRGYHPIAATQIRMIAAVIGFALVITVASAWRRVGESFTQRTAFSYTALGAFFGPTIGISLSLVAVTHTQAGIAAAVIATQQVWMVVATVAMGRERVGWGGIGGALLAVAGVILLVWA